MKLVSASEILEEKFLANRFSRFVNEAGPATFEPSVEKIKNCINERKYAGIYYEEEDDPQKVLSGFRLIEPYTIGKGYISPLSGAVSFPERVYLRAWVIKESRTDRNKQLHKMNRHSVSKTERTPYFRMFLLERINTWETFRFKIRSARDGYNPNDKMIKEIMASVEF